MKTTIKKQTKQFRIVRIGKAWRVVRKGSRKYAPFAADEDVAKRAAELCNATGSWSGYGTLIKL